MANVTPLSRGLACFHTRSSSMGDGDLQVCWGDADGVQNPDVRQLAPRRAGRPSRRRPQLARDGSYEETPVGPGESVSAGRHGRFVDPAVIPVPRNLKVLLGVERREGSGMPASRIAKAKVAGSGRLGRNFDQILSKQEGTRGSLRGPQWTSRFI